MRTKAKYVIIGVLLVLILAVFPLACDTFSNGGGETNKHCTDFDYPLRCPDADVCCPRGHPYYCDGNCYESNPGGCINLDTCREEK